MLIENGKIFNDNDSLVEIYDFDSHSVYYKGLLFISGHKEGKESLASIVNDLKSTGKINYKSIYGNYFLFIEDKINNSSYAFTDNSGIFKAFKYNNTISLSFLSLIDKFSKDINDRDINLLAINEFFHFGFTYFNKTFIKSINRIGADDVIVFKGNDVITCSKNIGKISDPSSLDFPDFYEKMLYSLYDKFISVDLTGGFDSRLNVSLIYYYCKKQFELSISGIKGLKDITIGEKVAKAINKKLIVTYHKAENLSENDFNALFQITDSQIDIIDYHRNSQLITERKNRNVDVQISGAGGELYKDFWWLQDFPFYNSKNINISRLYDHRIESTPFPHHILGKKLQEISLGTRSDTIKELQKLVATTNTQSYDNIYYYYKMNGNASTYISVSNNYIKSYTPLLEKELVSIGYNLPRKMRFFSNFHRGIITTFCPRISRIKTTEKISSSSKVFNKLGDLLWYFLDKGKRMLKAIIRALFGITIFHQTPTNPGIYNVINASDVYASNFKRLMQNGYIAPGISKYDVPNKFKGKVIVIGIFLERLRKNSTSSSS